MLKNNKAQVGESVTWIVATVILIIILIVFIYASIILSESKNLKSKKNSDSGEYLDWINVKTEMAYSINDQNKDKIRVWILKEKNEE
jgi:hypothetical protein